MSLSHSVCAYSYPSSTCSSVARTTSLLHICVFRVGAAIGLAIGNSYHEGSKAALGTQGTLNAVAAGILLYNGIVDLIIPGVRTSLTPISCRFYDAVGHRSPVLLEHVA